MPNHLQLDHIVLVVPNLVDAIDYFQTSLGVTPILGGKHTGLGTHNALLGLGEPDENIYLELLAIDPDSQNNFQTFPMGLEKNIRSPYVASWCIRCAPKTDLIATNQMMQSISAEYDHGEIKNMERITPTGQTLSWQLAIDPEKIMTSKGQIPFLIKWDDFSLQPAHQIAKENFCSYDIKFFSPEAKQRQENLQNLGLTIPNEMSFIHAPKTAIHLNLHKDGKSISFTS